MKRRRLRPHRRRSLERLVRIALAHGQGDRSWSAIPDDRVRNWATFGWAASRRWIRPKRGSGRGGICASAAPTCTARRSWVWRDGVARGRSPTCAIMAFTGMKTWDDVIHSKRPIRMGGVRAGTAYDDAPTILNNVAGTKFEVITGYKGTSPIRIALQSREVEGACLGWESMRVSDRAMLDANGDE